MYIEWRQLNSNRIESKEKQKEEKHFDDMHQALHNYDALLLMP